MEDGDTELAMRPEDGVSSDQDPDELDEDDADADADLQREQCNSEQQDSDEDQGDAGECYDDCMLRHWAASVIQQRWRRLHRTRQSTLGLSRRPSTDTRDVCCACFRPLDRATISVKSPADEVLCAACRELALMERDGVGASSPVGVFTTLPKLSRLVQTEKRYQSQLELLRQHQELLQRQRQEIEMRRKANEEVLARERQLARLRRKHFKQLMGQRQEAEKLRELQLTTSSATPRDTDKPPASSKRRPRVHAKKPASSMPGVILDPDQLKACPIPPPMPAKPSNKDEVKGSKAAALAEKAAQAFRRQQRQRMVSCYAQDLTPLVHGSKPKKLPVPTAVHAPSAKLNQPSKPVRLKKTPSKIRLVPLDNHLPTVTSNQALEGQVESSLRVLIPRRSFPSSQPTPLTAEIKPVAWMFDLAKDVLPSAPSPAINQASSATQQEPLATIVETPERPSLLAAPVTRAALAPLSSEPSTPVRFEWTPNSSTATIATTTAPAAPAPTSAAVPTGKWEYSSERLASLLAKYSISVTQANAGSTTKT
ncbi:hypothetical protein PINS_up006049 [Pythium insidiosum]|nr:hypothetical protein PINS_up006049 [Pythium insidiosum]